MSGTQPYSAVKQPAAWPGHALGVIVASWGLIAWIEWFAVPLMVPDRGGPLPYIEYAGQSLLLALGCLVGLLVVWLAPVRITAIARVGYAMLPATYLLYQLLYLVESLR